MVMALPAIEEKTTSAYMLNYFDFVDEDQIADAKVWHKSLAADSNRLFEIAAHLDLFLPEAIMNSAMVEVQTLYRKVEKLAYCTPVMSARWHLLNAASDIIAGLNDAIIGNLDTAQAYMTAAKVELGFYDIELAKIGV